MKRYGPMDSPLSFEKDIIALLDNKLIKSNNNLSNKQEKEDDTSTGSCSLPPKD